MRSGGGREKRSRVVTGPKSQGFPGDADEQTTQQPEEEGDSANLCVSVHVCEFACALVCVRETESERTLSSHHPILPPGGCAASQLLRGQTGARKGTPIGRCCG